MESETRTESSGTLAQVREEGRDLVGQAQQQVLDKTDEVKSRAGERLRDQVERQSATTGDQVHALGKALRRSSEQLRSEGKDVPASAVEQAADRAESLGSYLRDANADRILRDVESFARRRPWLTGVAGVAAGLLASRFLKASSQRRYEARDYQSYGSHASDGRELVAGGVR